MVSTIELENKEVPLSIGYVGLPEDKGGTCSCMIWGKK